MGDSGFCGPARRSANVQACEIRGSASARTPDLGFPRPSGRAWSSECGKFWAPLSVEMEFVQVWEIRGSLTQQDGGRACRCARFGDPPGRQTWGSLVHPDGHGNVGFSCLLGRNLSKRGDSGSPCSAGQECARFGISSSARTQVFGFPYSSGRTPSKCSKSRVLWSVGTEFAQTTGDWGFPGPTGGRACENRGSPFRDEKNWGSLVQVREAGIPRSITTDFVQVWEIRSPPATSGRIARKCGKFGSRGPTQWNASVQVRKTPPQHLGAQSSAMLRARPCTRLRRLCSGHDAVRATMLRALRRRGHARAVDLDALA